MMQICCLDLASFSTPCSTVHLYAAALGNLTLEFFLKKKNYRHSKEANNKNKCGKYCFFYQVLLIGVSAISVVLC